MGKTYETITADIGAWIREQHVFFVATAPLSGNGHVNTSPKGLDCLRITGPRQVAYLDVTGPSRCVRPYEGALSVRLFVLILACMIIVGCSERRAAPADLSVPAVTSKAPDSAPATELTCNWPGFARNASMEQLTAKFGESNVNALEAEEGFTPVILFPKDPKQEMHLKVFNGAEFSGASVESPASTWTIPGGIGMGASLEDVVRANGRPFAIHVYQDGAGITDWKGGALAADGCSFFVTFKHTDQRITGASTLMSDDPSVRALGLKVFRFGVN